MMNALGRVFMFQNVAGGCEGEDPEEAGGRKSERF
jgi:hypothetical protein